MTKEALKLALEALGNTWTEPKSEQYKVEKEAITALQKALANEALDKKAENARELGLDYEPAPQKPIIKSYLKKDNSQPVKWSDYEPDGMHHNKRPQNCGTGYCSCIECVMEPAQQEPVAIEHCIWARNGNTPCPHTSPPQRTWVGLTNNELQPIADEYRILFGSWVEDFARAIEAKLRSKNNG